MSINIACSAPDCSNPVIGQCTGYKKTCGKYYCREHSSDTLCADCTKRKATDEREELEQKAAQEHAELVYKEYLALAEKVSKDIPIPKFQFQDKNLLKAGGWSLAIGSILLFVLIIISAIARNINWDVPQGLMTFYTLSILGTLAILSWPFGLIPLVWLTQNNDWVTKERQKVISARISEFEQEKQGFSQFYNAWVKQRQEEQAEKNKQALIGVLTVVGAIAAIGLAAATHESDYDRTRRAVRDEINTR